jgi:diacylglycerol O-acyltransferase
MTICDLAVSRYFEQENGVPDEPLIAYMPVNLRVTDEVEDGNLISLIQVKLASDHRNPADSLRQVQKSIKSARELFAGSSRPAIQYYTLMVALLAQIEETLKLDRLLPPAINLVISNVPGPRERLYYKGAELESIYPITTLPPTTALNVTACSYSGTLYFGLIAGRTAIPDLQKLTDCLDGAYAEFRELAGIAG